MAASSTPDGSPRGRIDRWLADGGSRAAADPLFRALLESSVVPDPRAEAALTTLRCSLLRRTAAGDPAIALPLLLALAQHCFINEYAFTESADETAVVADLAARIERALADDAPLPEPVLAMLAAYRPLHRLAGAARLARRALPAELDRLIDRQIREPLEEARLAAALPRLTPIAASSDVVRGQYEANPYPRWVRVSTVAPTSLHAALRTMFPDAALAAPEPTAPEILIAGCGTGKHAIETALRFLGSRVLAIDLSLASLGYAQRKTRELGLAGVDYAQADILHLERLERRFDVVEAVGVLHHMADPIAGWRILAGLLRPAGCMRLGLYSTRARAHIARTRATIAARGEPPTAETIRRFRRELLQRGDADARLLAASPDFYSISGCRDLLFNARERHFDLPEIGRALDALGLELLGFELDDATVRAFRAHHPSARDTDLAAWDGFEAAYPETFRRMYQFWVRRR